MIRTIDAIKINGSRQAWNGYIYNLSYQPSFGQAPSYATINLISEDGTYSIQNTDLQVLTPHTIQIGNNITLTMFPVNFKINQSSSGKTLEVRYIDTSIILDKRIVVLNGRQGNDGSVFPINPFETTIKTYPDDEYSGSCYIPLGQELITPGETYFDVLNVVYTFPQLIKGIAENGIVIDQDSFNLIQNSNQYYHNSYIGTLRGVLSQWCTDLGYGFYWENNSLHFLDLTTPLILNTSSFDNSVQEANTTEVSIEDTVGRVACAFYGQNRQILGNYPGQNTEISFKCLTMSQVGLTQDQINSVKAAFLGEEFFYAYHFLLNSSYGNNILGILARTSVDTVYGRSLDPDPNTPWYSEYIYTAQDFTLKEANYKAYKAIADLVGVHYYKGMNFGDYKLITWENGRVEFFDQLLPCSATSIGDFAASLGSGAEQLYQFLIGAPFSSSTTADPTIVLPSSDSQTSSINKYDNTNGDAIANFKGQSWEFDYLGDGNFVPAASDDIVNFIHQNNFSAYYPVEFGPADTQAQIFNLLQSNVLNIGNAQTVINNVKIPYDVRFGLYGIATPFPNNGNFDLTTIKTPEDIYPNKLINVYINNNAQAVQPKVEEFFRSETDKTGDTVNCNSNVIKTEMNFRQIAKEDLLALGTLAVGYLGALYTLFGIHIVFAAFPNPQTLEEAFTLFSQNLTWSKVDPTIVKTYSLPYIDLPDNYQPLIGNGLINLQIKMDEKGVNSTYTMGTRLMQIPSIESIRMNLEFQRGTNQSRFLPYGYTPFVL